MRLRPTLLCFLGMLGACTQTPVAEPRVDVEQPEDLQPAEPVDLDQDGVAGDADCDDEDATVFPGATELCDDIDHDCDGDPQNGLRSAWFADLDADGFGDASAMVEDCQVPEGHVSDDTDCDDADRSISPVGIEVCDGVDQDCDGEPDNGVTTDYFPDLDLDGFGDASAALASCDPVDGRVLDGTDCDDEDATVHPGGDTARCDGVDSDCDGVIEELRVPADHPTIHEAVSSAVDGDWVCVAAGVYAEQVSVSGSIVLEGAGPEATILDARGAGRALSLAGGPTVVRGLTVRGGHAGTGAGVQVSGEAVLDTVHIIANRCEGTCFGVGLAVRPGAHLQMMDGRIHDNTATITTGAGDGGGVHSLSAEVVIRNTEISGNRMTGLSSVEGVARGGGVFLSNGTHVLEDVDIVDNALLRFAEAQGGGVAQSNGSLMLRRSMVQGNTLEAGDAYGAGVDLAFGEAQLHNVGVVGNGIDATYSHGVGLHVDLARTSLSQVSITQNHDDSPAPRATGIVVDGSTTLVVRNSDVSNNGSTVGSAGIGIDRGANLDMRYSNVYGHEEAVDGGWAFAEGDGNLEVAPLYVGASLLLEPTSNLVDSGDPTVLDSDGSRSDIGAFGGPGGGW